MDMVYKFRKLLEPIKIRSVEIKNRVAMTSMGVSGLLNLEGNLGPRGVDYYLERAGGNVGLIITGLFKLENDIEPFWPGLAALVSRGALSCLAELADAVHPLGSKIFIQLTAGLGRVPTPRILRGQPVSASATPFCRASEKIFDSKYRAAPKYRRIEAS